MKKNQLVKSHLCCVAMLTSILLLMAPSVLHAQTIKLSPEIKQGTLTIKVEHAKLRDVLSHIASHHGFEVKFNPSAKNLNQRLSMTLTGKLNVILSRLLRNTNHMVVRSQQTPSIIKRIILMADMATDMTKSSNNTDLMPTPRRPLQPPPVQQQTAFDETPNSPVKALKAASIWPPQRKRNNKEIILDREQTGWLE